MRESQGSETRDSAPTIGGGLLPILAAARLKNMSKGLKKRKTVR
jgi:hypothetical protein